MLKAVGRRAGVLFEVGSHQGDDTFLNFARRGWEIHAFEPDPTNRARLIERVAGMSNVTVVPVAVSNEAGKMQLFTSEESTGISSLAPFTDGHRPSVEVDVIPLRSYIAEHSVSHIDFLKIDVEGFERFVLEGFPWEKIRPTVILLEFEDRKTVPLGYRWSDLADLLQDHGYAVLVSEWAPITKYGTHHRWLRFGRYPDISVDEQGWGNLLAVSQDQIARFERLGQFEVRRARSVDALGRLVSSASRRLTDATQTRA